MFKIFAIGIVTAALLGGCRGCMIGDSPTGNDCPCSCPKCVKGCHCCPECKDCCGCPDCVKCPKK